MLNDQSLTVAPRHKASGAANLICWLLIALLSGVNSAALYAQSDVPGDPSSTSGDFDGLSTTAGGYDTYSGNIKRTITDAVVPGTAGTIPLQFTRIYNSRANYVPTTIGAHFGDANWRHNYQWEGQITTNINGKTVYQVGYPDGRVINFRLGRTGVVSDTFARGPSATTDRFEISPQRDPAHHYLHLADGSQVMFSVQPDSNGTYDLLRAERLIDPYGATTALIYGTYTTTHSHVVNVLLQIVEPGGRSLNLTYGTESIPGLEWAVFKSVYWQDTQGTVHQDASYIYYTFETDHPNEIGQTNIYTGLQSVVYSQTQKNNSQAYVTAHYTYYAPDNPGAPNGTPPLLLNADDPYFSGPMHQIHYVYAPATNNGVWGIVQAEQNYISQENVSSLVQDQPNTPTSATESRGDYTNYNLSHFVSRTFQYGEDPSHTTITNAQAFQVRTATDFEGNASTTYYYPPGDSAYRWGYVSKVTNPSGTSTLYDVEPYAGKIKQITLPSGLTRSTVWGGADGNAANPYYVLQTTDEHLKTTQYIRNTNTGLVSQINYPDHSHEFFTYQYFSGPNGGYYKIATYNNKLGAQFTFNYGQNDDGQGPSDLLRSITRNYTDAITGAPHSETISYGYDPTNRVNKVKDQRGISEQFIYNARGQILQVLHTSETNPSHVDYVYEDDGTCTKIYDELGHGTTFTYDDYRRVTSVKVPVNAPPAYSNQPIQSRTRWFAYDRRDNSNRSIGTARSHTGTNWSVSWLPSSAGIQRIFSHNNWLTDEYDGMSIDSSPYPVMPAQGTATVHKSLSLNVLGQPTSATAYDQGPTTLFSYDAYNRPWTVTDPLGHTASKTYYGPNQPSSSTNYAGWPQSITAPAPDLASGASVTTNYTGYDLMGRLLTTVDPDGHTFDSGVDAAGNLTSQDDGAQNPQSPQSGHSTAYAYDTLGRKSQITYPVDNTTEQWTYDQSGNVATYKNRTGAICTYSYLDPTGSYPTNRCSGYSWSNGAAPSVNYEYDAAGHVTRVNNPYSDVHFTYDDSGAVRTEQSRRFDQSATLVTTYTHDQDGNVDSIQSPHGEIASYTHDSLGRCTQVILNNVSLDCQYNYQQNKNLLDSRCLPYCGLVTRYGYQNNGRVSAWLHCRGDQNGNPATNGSIRLQYYGYAPDGRMSWTCRVAGWDQSGNNSALDASGQGDAYYYYPDGSFQGAFRNVGTTNGGWPQAASLTQDSRVDPNAVAYYGGAVPSAIETYAYDGAGNRTITSAGTYPAADGANRYVPATPNYDTNGNLAVAADGWQYIYNANNELIYASNTTTGQIMGFNYDGLGRVSGELANGRLTTYCYAGNQRIEERDNTGNPVYQYYFDGPDSDQILFRRDETTWGNLWYLYDQLGNVTHLCGDAGNVVEAYLYDAYGTPTVYDQYGNVRPSGTAFDNHYLYKGAGGYRWFLQAQLYYCRARFYQPMDGRWLQPDPIGQAGGVNIYAYCGNDPINSIDPSGLDETTGGFSFTNDPGSNPGVFDPDGPTGGVLELGSFGGVDLAPLPIFVGNSGNSVSGGKSGSAASGRGPINLYTLVPVLYNRSQAIENFTTGHPWKGTGYTVLAATDVLLVRSLATVAIKGVALVGTRLLLEDALEVGSETFYRTMSEAHYKELLTTSRIAATGETFISPSLEYASLYDGITVQLTVKAGTYNSLLGIGMRSENLLGGVFDSLPMIRKGWTLNNAFFKLESNVVNVGLGRGAALDLFNDNILSFTLAP